MKPRPSSEAQVPPITIVRIIARLNIGGPARHVAWLDDGLRRGGGDPLLVFGSVDAGEGSFEDLVDAFGLRAEKVPELGRRVHVWSDVLALWRVTRIIFRERPDVVHTHTAKAGTIGRLAAFAYNATRRRSRRSAVIHTFHGHVFSGYFTPAGSAAARLVERVMARMTDRIVTLSESQKDEIGRRYRIAPLRRIDVIELGLDLAPLLALDGGGGPAAPFGFGHDAVVFGYVGRFAPVKDLPTLLDAFAVVAARVPQARLLLVGDGEPRPHLERLASSLGVGDRVRFTGWQRDLAAVYGSVDVAVLSSRNEGTPVALIEAMAAARPVVATAVGGVSDVVAHGQHGLLVPAGDAAALAAAMERLAKDAGERAAFGRAAREAVRTRFSRERLVADVSRCYARALGEKRPRTPPATAAPPPSSAA